MAEEETEKLGCKHYERKCAFVSPCCQHIYTCRLCHDEEENHDIDRTQVNELECLKCKTRQEVQNECKKCGIKFGLYFCGKCRLFDDVDKKQFHCEECGICRVGGRENFFHCPKCDMCLAVDLKDSHKCIEKASRSNCPICLEDLHTSRIPCQMPHCGHLVHTPCWKDMLSSGNYACALCGESMIDMKESWKMLETEVNEVQMPEEYRNTKVHILCRDCHEESEVLFHVIGLQCGHCGSFNTCRTAESKGKSNMNTDRPEEEDSDSLSESDTEDGATGSIGATSTATPTPTSNNNNNNTKSGAK